MLRECSPFLNIFFAVAIAVSASPAFAEDKSETPHIAFVTEYVRELAAIENIRESGQRELQNDPKNNFAEMIHTGTLFKLELASHVAALKGMNLKIPYDDLIPSLAVFYRNKIALWQRL